MKLDNDGIEAWTTPDSLVLCASYSGETEETLGCFEAAGAAGAQRVVLTTGGTLAQLARDDGVTTVFSEQTVSPRIAETLAREAGGVRTVVLSPLESLTKKEQDAGADYFTLMNANLDKIAAALGCPPRS